MSKILDLTIEETAQHKRAFTIYSTLDPELSSADREAQVAARLGSDVDPSEVHTWASFFHWEEKLAQDAQIIQKGMDARTRKEKLRGQVENVVNRISTLLNDEKTFANITIDDGKTLSQLAGALDKLAHTMCILDGTAVDTVVLKSDKPVSELSDEELAQYIAEGRARAASRDDGPEAA
jgi:hypothetical protein